MCCVFQTWQLSSALLRSLMAPRSASGTQIEPVAFERRMQMIQTENAADAYSQIRLKPAAGTGCAPGRAQHLQSGGTPSPEPASHESRAATAARHLPRRAAGADFPGLRTD